MSQTSRSSPCRLAQTATHVPIRRTRHAESTATCARSSTRSRSPGTNRQRRGSKGGRPTGFNKEIYKRRNEVERTINRFKNFRAAVTRSDKRAYVFHGTVTVAAIRLRLRP